MKRRKQKNNDTDPMGRAAALVNQAAETVAILTEVEPAQEPKRRQLIVVDLETTGTHDDAAILEVAAINVDTGDTLYFVPHITQEALSKAEPKAMQINRYYERGLFEQALSPKSTGAKYRELQEMLSGNTFAGSNPAFDSRILAAARFPKLMPAWDYGRDNGLLDYVTPFGRPWHHRLADLSAYAAGKLDIDLDDLPGLDAVVAQLLYPDAIDIAERHTAAGDAAAAAACFELLRGMRPWHPRFSAAVRREL